MVDVSKVFDTLDWKFLLKVLSIIGFNSKFYSWISSINGTLHGFFKCNRGERQRGPVSFLLFYLDEEVLIRSITLLVAEWKLDFMSGVRKVNVPSHILYADYIFILCKGKSSNISILKCVFTKYSSTSGQVFSQSKSAILFGSMCSARLDLIVASTGFSKGSIPFNYLGVQLFKRKVKEVHLHLIDDKVLSNLSSWISSLLSIARKVCLGKSMI